MKSAEAGATMMASQGRVRLMCAIAFGSRKSHWLKPTGRPDSACIVTGVMNWQAASVITTCTVAPWRTSARTSSADL